MSQLFLSNFANLYQLSSVEMLSDSHKMWAGPRDQWAETVAGSEEKSLGV